MDDRTDVNIRVIRGAQEAKVLRGAHKWDEHVLRVPGCSRTMTAAIAEALLKRSDVDMVRHANEGLWVYATEDGYDLLCEQLEDAVARLMRTASIGDAATRAARITLDDM